MELFSEIYSCYYTVVNKILNEAFGKALSKKDMSGIINENAFEESALFILPKLISGEWNLLNDNENKYTSKLTSSVKLPVTSLEKAWLKSLLMDRRIGLFLSNEQILSLNENLKGITPLFNMEDFHNYDIFLDGDDYESEEYAYTFRLILDAIKNKKLLTISTESKGKRVTGIYIPIRLEYSSKDDKFRVYAARIKHYKIQAYVVINLGRISKIEPCEGFFNGEINLQEYMDNNKCTEPVVIEISKERNAVERCMLHFASYEKRTEYDESTDKYICHIYYDRKDETELLIRILSFGPVIKVLAPSGFLDLVKERVMRQKKLLEPFNVDFVK